METRNYWDMHHGNTDEPANSALPILNPRFVCKGFPAKKKENPTGDGLKWSYGMHADYHLGIGSIAVRKIPCQCKPCFNQVC